MGGGGISAPERGRPEGEWADGEEAVELVGEWVNTVDSFVGWAGW